MIDTDEPGVDETPDLFLASASPRRYALLRQLGLKPAVVDATIDEGRDAAETPSEYVRRMALAKARAGRTGAPLSAARPLLAADTAVVVDERVLGKPAHREEAMAMLALLSGRRHHVLTGVALLGPGPGTGRDFLEAPEYLSMSDTEVCMRRIEPTEAAAYWASGEPRDKAGAYALQGVGAVFVEHIRGSYSGVVGLPLFETAVLLARVGILALDRPIGERRGGIDEEAPSVEARLSASRYSTQHNP